MNTTLPDEITRPARSYTARGFVIGALVFPAAFFVIWLALLAFRAAGVSLGVGATLSVVWLLIPGMSLSMWINMADDAGCVGLCRGYIMGTSATGALVCGVLCLVLASPPNPTTTAQATQYTSAVSSPRH
ncbi:hypothetical protein BX589_101100 [Paraburkholderia fungorum]|jgi:hypothetical protein|uniref:hypothetical protein n=1 Tax=Paraburkholderia fungorum TaxID=134537 RepID=UPI000D0536E6|nr:hypothetical protein [Paraburkholderia fungorum]PRZ56450.1 hypothetical protein BX589_101100 [Paraburkholderia fungorum]